MITLADSTISISVRFVRYFVRMFGGFHRSLRLVVTIDEILRSEQNHFRPLWGSVCSSFLKISTGRSLQPDLSSRNLFPDDWIFDPSLNSDSKDFLIKWVAENCNFHRLFPIYIPGNRTVYFERNSRLILLCEWNLCHRRQWRFKIPNICAE